MPRRDEQYKLALAIQIEQGEITVNGYPLSAKTEDLPKGVTRAGENFVIPEDSLLATVGDARFSLFPVKNYPTRIEVSDEPYARVRGRPSEREPYFIMVSAPTETKVAPEEDHRRNKTPVSYLHFYEDNAKRAYVEFQANEGCVRVTLPPDFVHMR